jgi:hypothetical protein
VTATSAFVYPSTSHQVFAALQSLPRARISDVEKTATLQMHTAGIPGNAAGTAHASQDLRRRPDDAMLGRPSVAAHEERLAVLETTVSEHAQTFADFRESMFRMEQRIDARFDRLDDRLLRLMTWLVGMQITVLLAIIGSLLSILAILAPQ